MLRQPVARMLRKESVGFVEKTLIRFRQCVRVICVAYVTVTFAALAAYAQEVSPKALEVIPEPFRQQFVEKLGLYVEYQRTKQYDKLYDLFSPSTIHTVFNDQTREEFVRAYQKGDIERTSVRLLEFKPTAIQKMQSEDTSDEYVIWGRAEMCQMGESIKKRRVAVVAQLQDGKWYFSPIMDALVD